MNKWMKRGFLFLGLALSFFPMVSNLIVQHNQRATIATYQQAVNMTEDKQVEESVEAAEKYNELLFKMQGAVVDDLNLVGDDAYAAQLNYADNDIMGSLEIPKINVNLSIYHGTEDEVLSEGIGHLQWSSLPVGGENTHCILTGHRGLPSSKLLVRLDEMELDDYFFLRVGNETLAYQVIDINVIEPEEVDGLEIQAGKDLVSLVTCTPYGINTHRLVVTGTRVEYEDTDYEEIGTSMPSVREIMTTLFPFCLLLLVISVYLGRRFRKIHEKKKQVE